MMYLRVRWIHSDAEYPVLIFSEWDADNFDTRIVEVFLDGHCEFASSTEQSANGGLGECANPPLSEIALDPEFDPIEISKDEFECVWDARDKVWDFTANPLANGTTPLGSRKDSEL